VLDKLQLLNEQQRQVIQLRFIEGLSIAETAHMMQKSEGAIKALQHRSLESLRRYLET
jgi:RNA polymerase sigma-70 factor (ECF subfamily)